MQVLFITELNGALSEFFPKIVNRLAVLNRTPIRFRFCCVVRKCFIGYDAKRLWKFQKPRITAF